MCVYWGYGVLGLGVLYSVYVFVFIFCICVHVHILYMCSYFLWVFFVSCMCSCNRAVVCSICCVFTCLVCLWLRFYCLNLVKNMIFPFKVQEIDCRKQQQQQQFLSIETNTAFPNKLQRIQSIYFWCTQKYPFKTAIQFEFGAFHKCMKYLFLIDVTYAFVSLAVIFPCCCCSENVRIISDL